MSVEVRALYVYLLGGGLISSLFFYIFPTRENRKFNQLLSIAVAKSIYPNNSGYVVSDELFDAVKKVDGLVEKYGIGCIIKMCDDFDAEK